MDPSDFDALSFDCYGTLIDWEAGIAAVLGLFHDHVPAQRAGLPTVWINRRHDRVGWGATPAPAADVTPDWEFPSMRAFAAAATGT